MELVGKLDDLGKPAWIALMVVGFVLFWPIGLAILAYLIWSGRMGCSRHSGPGRWYRAASERRGRHRRKFESGNSAFDEYREDTLRRLEDEQREFEDFLEQLRHAKDKAEFDEFMRERKRRPKDGDAKDRDARDIPDDPAAQPQT
jgi:hypothetical protein